MIELNLAGDSFSISGRKLTIETINTLLPMVEANVRIFENVATLQDRSSVEPGRLLALQAVMMKIEILFHEAEQLSEQGVHLSIGALSAIEAGFPEFDPKSPLHGSD